MEQLTREQARRIAVRAQELDLPRPDDPREVVRHLTGLQVDLARAVAPSAEIVLWSRLGGSVVQRTPLDSLLGDGSLVEIAGRLRPIEDVTLFRAEMADRRSADPLAPWPAEPRRWIAANDGARRDVLALLRSEGPLPARLIPDTCAVPWRSTGWTNGKNVMKLLEIMEARGEVAVAGRDGGERAWDLAARIWPDDPLSAPGLPEARAERERRLLAAQGLVRSTRSASGPEDAPHVTIEHTRGVWVVDSAQLDRLDGPFRGRCALLSPLDPLVTDRSRLGDVFGFDYLLEMYKPAAARRWGYWAMPVLWGDALVGKLDAETDWRRRRLRVNALHLDAPLSPECLDAVTTEIGDLAFAFGLELDLDVGNALQREVGTQCDDHAR